MTKHKITKRLSFGIPGELKRPGARKWEMVCFFIQAPDRKDALWQARHGAIDATVSRDFPGATFKYDLRRMRRMENE